MEKFLVFKVLGLFIFLCISLQSTYADITQKDLISILRQFVQSGGNS
jgi:hypothetical protein